MTAKTKKIAPIPRGYRAITPHITTANVSAAVELYQTAFGATLTSTESAPDCYEPLFAQLKIGNSNLTIAQGDSYGAGFVSLHHYVEDIDATWAAAQAAGFTEISPIEETYWGDRMGVLSDPLGVRWSIGQRVCKLNADERQDRARAALGAPNVVLDEPVVEEAAPVAPLAEEAPQVPAGTLH